MPFCYCLFVVVVVINGKLSRFALSFLFISSFSFSLSFVLFFVLSLYQASELECVANVIAVVVVVFELIVVAVAARI